ncbi:hypothetical protein LSH36_387g01065 [Paralvinella palmiformis]|uniref:Peptidase S1 domain-containing protein n=1 Tax=Paralvinella palmiformis TaxID=53620 RepID=A0AAD9JDM6_9ANNE|nr:hypothetical protein LSH36_387g01065 [Paralvinella palmiformis]
MLRCLFVLAVCSFVSGEKPCGRLIELPGNTTSKIIGDEDISSHEALYPWHLAVERRAAGDGSWTYSCGATLIYPDWAVTAGWCVENSSSGGSLAELGLFRFLEEGNTLKGTFLKRRISFSYRIIAGEYNRSLEEGTEQYIDVAGLFMHPDYNYSAPYYANNLALIQLATPANLSNNYINVVCLPPSDDISYVENPNCYVTGWGVTSSGGQNVDVLRRAGTDVIRTEVQCLLRIGDGFWVNDDQYCIQDQANKVVSVCDGDQGGPLSCMVDATWYLAGILSHVTSSTCDPGKPQICSNTAKYLTWIADVTGN